MSGISKAKKKDEMDGVCETEMDGVRKTICIYYSKNTGSEEEEENVTDGEEEFVLMSSKKDEGVIFIGSDSDDDADSDDGEEEFVLMSSKKDEGVIFIGSDSDDEDDADSDNPSVIYLTTIFPTDPREGSSAMAQEGSSMDPQEGSSAEEASSAREPEAKKKKKEPADKEHPATPAKTERKSSRTTTSITYIKRNTTGPVAQDRQDGNKNICLVKTLTNGNCLLDCIVQSVDIRPYLMELSARFAGTPFQLINVDENSTNATVIANLRKLIAFEMNENPDLLHDLFELINPAFADLLDKNHIIDQKLNINLPPAESEEDLIKQELSRSGQLLSRTTFKEQFPGYLLSSDFDKFKEHAFTSFISNPRKYIDNITYGYLERVLAKIPPGLRIQKLEKKPTPEQLQQNAASTIFVTNAQQFTHFKSDGPTPHYMLFVLGGKVKAKKSKM